MASNKAALKAAKSALDAQKWDEAIVQAQKVLASDGKNYFATLFLGRAYEKQGKLDDAIKAYSDATNIKPHDDQALLGLRGLYEGQGSNKVDEYITVSTRLAEIYAEAEDKHKSQSAVDKLTGFVRNRGTRSQLKRSLEIQLPTSPLYSFLEGRLPHPSHTYARLAEITEDEEKEKINKEIGERRTRIGARKDQVTVEVKREIYNKSNLENLYHEIINWTHDDEVRRQTEEKLIRRVYDTLLTLPFAQKVEKRKEVMDMARGMVIIKHPFTLAWDIALEWSDPENVGDMDFGVLQEYVSLFPERGLSKILAGFLSSEISPFPLQPSAVTKAEESDDGDEGGGVSLNPAANSSIMSAEERLVLMIDGLHDAKQSPLSHRLMAEYYTNFEEDESTVETSRNGLKLLKIEAQKSGLKLQNSFDAMNTLLASALIRYQSPRNHAEAKSLFEDILTRKPNFTKALIGIGLILKEEDQYAEAVDYLTKALKRDPNNTRIGAEAAWCKALNGDLDQGLKELERYYQQMDADDPRTRETRAETLYRIGKCQWELDPKRESRKNRSGPYAKFLASIKVNVHYAPPYTMLGIYYSDYAHDKKRTRQCFQKAFDLSASEIEAAERLARSFANQSDWDIVEIIAQRVIDSGKARPPPGSKKKGISWPYSTLGVAQMNKQEFQQAIVSFLAALRISPDDYHSYVGLGESYHNSGRYNSALRTFNYVENPEDGVRMKKTGESWFTRYMLANVNRELGLFDKAIEGYKEVLQSRPKEFGVEIALLQTLIEQSWRYIESGFFGRAMNSAKEAFEVASSIVEYRPQAFNLWKAIADACSIFSWVQGRLADFPVNRIQDLLTKSFNTEEYKLFVDVDAVGPESLKILTADTTNGSLSTSLQNLKPVLVAAILAQKRAIISCSNDIHAQAVAWYNLGWVEHRAHVCLEQSSARFGSRSKEDTKFLKASMRCFKRAIELEASNAEFWNALGVVTTTLNAKVAQHSFVRSLHLNERSAKTWSNLGTLYLLQGDVELAHTAFARAQSTDPDYGHAWVGEGLIALILGDSTEALLHFKHAFEISDSSSTITKREYAPHSFDHLNSSSATLSNALNLVQPLFALRQLHTLIPSEESFDHLSALFNERIGSHNQAIESLSGLCSNLETEFEESESSATLARFAHAKADLARNLLAVHEYAAASDSAQTAIDLTSEPEGIDITPDHLRRLRLSARLTLGLASYYQHDMDAAISAFRSALEESDAAPDVVCLLAEVLWAKGGEDERNVVREQLFECVEINPQHVGAIVLLGVMAAIEEDAEMIGSVREELEGLRVSEGISERDEGRVELVLEAFAEIDNAEGKGDLKAMNEIQRAIMIAPGKPTGWGRLTDFVEDPFPAELALITAKDNVPPKGSLAAEELAAAFAGTGVIGDAQRAIMSAPWAKCGWDAFAEMLS